MDMVKGIGLIIGFTIILSAGLGIATSLLIGPDAYLEIDLQFTNITQLIEEFFDLLASEGLLQQWLIITFAAMVVGEGAMVYGAWRFSASKYRLGWRALGFRSFNVRKGLILATIVVLGGLLISILYDMLMTLLWEEPTSSATLEFTNSGLGLATDHCCARSRGRPGCRGGLFPRLSIQRHRQTLWVRLGCYWQRPALLAGTPYATGSFPSHFPLGSLICLALHEDWLDMGLYLRPLRL